MMEEVPKEVVKLIVLGNASVGKTCLIHRFVGEEVNQNYRPTIGMDSKSKEMVLEKYRVRAIIWEAGGQERFRPEGEIYYRGFHCCALVFDFTNRESFRKLIFWMELINVYNGVIPMILIGNNVDKIEELQVSKEEARLFSLKNGMEYFFVPSEGCVEDAFKTVLTLGLLDNQTKKNG